jgi:hypothetical protein
MSLQSYYIPEPSFYEVGTWLRYTLGIWWHMYEALFGACLRHILLYMVWYMLMYMLWYKLLYLVDIHGMIHVDVHGMMMVLVSMQVGMVIVGC